MLQGNLNYPRLNDKHVAVSQLFFERCKVCIITAIYLEKSLSSSLDSQ